MAKVAGAQKILSYWFKHVSEFAPITKMDSAACGKLWFGYGFANAEEKLQVDAHIKEQFEQYLPDAATQWPQHSVQDSLATLILYDQFTRNMFRNSKQAFAYDHIALQLSQSMILQEQDLALPLLQRMFVYLPLEHAESKQAQALSVQKFSNLLQQCTVEQPENTALHKYCTQLVQFAQQHKQLIDTFGRFPYRNAILGRESTDEEKANKQSFL